MTIRTKDASKQYLADKAIGKTKESETRKEILAVENKIRNNKTETAAVVKDGKKLIDKSEGKANEVSFTNAECQKMKGAVLTHNHPSGRTFSDADLITTVKWDLKEIRAAHSKGVYSIKQVGGATKSASLFPKDFEANRKKELEKNNATFFKNQDKYNKGKLSYDDFNKIIDKLNGNIEKSQDQWLMKNSKKYGYEYTKEKLGGK